MTAPYVDDKGKLNNKLLTFCELESSDMDEINWKGI